MSLEQFKVALDERRAWDYVHNFIGEGTVASHSVDDMINFMLLYASKVALLPIDDKMPTKA